MLGSSAPATLNLNPNPHFRAFQALPTNSHLKILKLDATETPRRRIRTRTRTSPKAFPLSTHHLGRTVITRVNSNDDSTNVEASKSNSSSSSSSSTLGDGYVSLFVRMLGLDNDPLDRDQGIVALWKYSLGGKKNIDNIMRFPGCVNLTVNLLRSETTSTCEAAAGLLRSISSVNLYRDSVAQSGAIEEITGLLNKPSLVSEVKEQSLCTLWNLSVDGKLRERMGSGDFVSILVKFLDDDEDIKVKEASGGILANLALSEVNHKSMVEEGVIPKLAKFLKNNDEGSKVLRNEARNALLELSRDEYYKILVVEEGLVHVPLVGPAAYKSYTPSLHSWPSLPDGTEIERGESQKPSRFGASELLLGLNVDDEKSSEIDEGKRNAVLGRSQQQFLVRIGAVEIEESESESLFTGRKKKITTLLPWIDGVARLVLLLELEDEAAISRSAEAIADASIGEDMRIAFRDAGAVKHLVRLLGYKNRSFEFQVVRALERLSVSNSVCQVIEAEGVTEPLLDILRCKDCSEDLLNKTLNILGRIFDTGKETRSKFNDRPVNGSDTRKTTDSAENGITKPDPRHSIMDLSAVDRLVEILKTSNSNLQSKAASVLEFIAASDPTLIASVDIEAGLDSVFKQTVLEEADPDLEGKEPEKYALQIEEAGQAISAASRLLMKLLESEPFRNRVDPNRFTDPLRKTLKSEIPLRSKKWVAECLVSIDESLPGPHKDDPAGPIRTEVTVHETVHETVPRLIEQIEAGPTREAREEAAAVLRWILSEGMVDPARARGCVGPVVGLMAEEGASDRAVEAGVAILYSVSAESEIRGEIVAAGAVSVLKRIVLGKRPQWNKALLLLKSLPT